MLGKCGGYTSDIADAIRWGAGLSVSGLPANPTPSGVLNLSLGGSGACSSTYQNAINAAVAAGTVVVVAAGNSNANAANYQPASCANVITVAATGHTGSRAYYSNYGATVEIAAPGGDCAGRQDDPLDAQRRHDHARRRLVRELPGNEHGDAACRRCRLADAVGQPVADARPGDDDAAGDRDAVPGREHVHTSTCGSGILNAAAAVAQAGGGAPPTLPGAFVKTAPAHLSQVSGTSATLQWGASSGAASYAYCIDTSNDGLCSSWLSTGTATSVTVSGLVAGTTYYWQARATNGVGDTLANGGSMWMFSTSAASALPGAFSKSSPTNGQSNRSRPVAISWGASTGATSYEWCVSTTSGSCPTTWTSTTVTAASVSGLSSRRTYYWQVRARNLTGATDANGGTWWSFRTR